MKIKLVSCNNLKANPIQPTVRTSTKSICNLKHNIEKYGLLQPIFISKDNFIIDGHRRVAVFKKLGYKNITANIYNGELKDYNYMNLWIKSNQDNMRIKSTIYLTAYLKGVDVPNYISKMIVFIVEHINRKFIRYLINKNISPHYPKRLYRTAKMLGINDRVNYEKFLKWVIEGKKFAQVMAFERGIITKNELLKTFK
jgi:hypothetical protein